MENNLDEKHTIKEILKIKSNDFSNEEVEYFKKINVNLLSYSGVSSELKINQKLSIIVPVYNSLKTILVTLESINHQNLTDIEYGHVEVIIVDDGSTDGAENILKNTNYKYKLIYVKQNNAGAACARNLGAQTSTSDVLIFIDSDIILQDNFVKEHAIRNQIINNACFIGFREHISPEANNLLEFAQERNIPAITKDVRFSRFFTKDWKRQHRACSSDDSREIKLIEETVYFKNFGEDRVLGAWDLPSMVQTFSLSLRRSTFIKSGGFNSEFSGWGMEDTYFGATLICVGNFIVPVLSTGVFHIEHSSRSGSDEKKQLEFNRNVKIYNDLINKIIT